MHFQVLGFAVKHMLISMKYFKTFVICHLFYILHSAIGSYFFTPYRCLVFQMAPGNVPPHNRHPMGHSDFFFFFEYFGKITSQKRQRLIAFIFINIKQHPGILKNNIDHLSKRGPPPFFHSDTNLVLGNVLVHSVEKTHVLVLTGELIWLLFLNILFLNYVQRPNKSHRFRKFRRSYSCKSIKYN